MFFKRKEKVVYMPIDEPMSQIDLAGAFNVQKDDAENLNSELKETTADKRGY